jgi:hypothetical protein
MSRKVSLKISAFLYLHFAVTFFFPLFSVYLSFLPFYFHHHFVHPFYMRYNHPFLYVTKYKRITLGYVAGALRLSMCYSIHIITMCMQVIKPKTLHWFSKKQRYILHKIQTPLLPTNQHRPRFEVVNIKKKKNWMKDKFWFPAVRYYRELTLKQ